MTHRSKTTGTSSNSAVTHSQYPQDLIRVTLTVTGHRDPAETCSPRHPLILYLIYRHRLLPLPDTAWSLLRAPPFYLNLSGPHLTLSHSRYKYQRLSLPLQHRRLRGALLRRAGENLPSPVDLNTHSRLEVQQLLEQNRPRVLLRFAYS